MVLHICLAANGMTLRLRAHAIKGRLMLSWVTSCICTTLVKSLGAMHPLSCHMLGQLWSFSWRNVWNRSGAVWSDFWVSFLVTLLQSFILDVWLWKCLNLKLQRWFCLQSEDQMDHAKSVFGKSAMKCVGQSISNGRIHASNEYL
jgi:hypothetical protein